MSEDCRWVWWGWLHEAGWVRVCKELLGCLAKLIDLGLQGTQLVQARHLHTTKAQHSTQVVG